MGFDRRMLVLFVVLAVVGLPAFTLRVLCVGHSCDEPVEASAKVPFCRLPAEIRSSLATGFREDRSPDVLGVTTDVVVGGGHGFAARDVRPQWPSIEPISREVPLVLDAPGLPGGALEGEIGLDDVAPTVAALMGLERPHPEVRSGAALGAVSVERPVPLVVQIVWKGIGSEDLRAEPASWTRLKELTKTGLSTLEAQVPSLPLDPAAVLTTIGTGGTANQHGITGTLVRNDEGNVVSAWGPDAPVSVIAGLGDDLDELTRQEARVGLIADERTDRGLIGKDWYVDTDRDDFRVARGRAQAFDAIRSLLADGYGDDQVPDLLAVTLSGTISEMDHATGRIAKLVRSHEQEAAVVVTATGSAASAVDLTGEEVEKILRSALGVNVVAAAVPGGLFLDQEVVAEQEITDDEVATALGQIDDSRGRPAFADVFPAIAVSFGRYC